MEKVRDYVKRHLYKQYDFIPYCNNKTSEEWIIKIINVLLNDQNTPKAGLERKPEWEKGWEENLATKSLLPNYFGKYPVVRWNRKFIYADSELEYTMFGWVLDCLFAEYLPTSHRLYEFGCGTGHNLVRAQNFLSPTTPINEIYGLDWADSACEFVERIGFKAIKFDMFNPPMNPNHGYTYYIKPDSVVLTVAAMEQLGTAYRPFINYLRAQPVQLVIHVEPIGELLHENNLMDYLSLKYFEKRGYLSGYLHYLISCPDVQILRVERSYVGSLFIDGYSVIVWRVVKSTTPS